MTERPTDERLAEALEHVRFLEYRRGCYDDCWHEEFRALAEEVAERRATDAAKVKD